VEDPLREDLAIAPLTLSAAERLILANQYEILERLYPTLRREYASRRCIVERGDAAHYHVLFSRPVSPPGGDPAQLTSEQSSEAVPYTPSLCRQESLAGRLRMSTEEPERQTHRDRGGALTPW
jgi:hypothetical protein